MWRLALLGVMVAARVAAAGDCADKGMTPKVLTPAKTVIDQDGGVVVGLVTAGVGPVPELAKLAWSFGKIAVTQVALAPGLVVMRPAKAATATLVLEDDQHHSIVEVAYRFAARDDLPTAAAPVVKSVAYRIAMGKRNFSDGTTVVLASPVPAGMVAIVGSTSQGVPLSWAPVTVGATSVAVAQSAVCVGQPAGTGKFRGGDGLVLAYVDVQGHISLSSSPVKVP